MLISDVFGLVAIVAFLLAILCAFNGWVFNIELLYGLFIVLGNGSVICFIIFVVLSLVMQAPGGH